MQLCCRSIKSCSSRLLPHHLLEAAWPGRLVTGSGPWSLCPVVWWEPHVGLPVLWIRSQRVQPGSLEDKTLLWKKHLSLPLLTALAGPAFQPRTHRKAAVRLRKQVPSSAKAVRRVPLKPGHHAYKLIRFVVTRGGRQEEVTQLRTAECWATLGPGCHCRK